MFFVSEFNNALEDFECVGAFSKKDEAEAFQNEREAQGAIAVHVVETNWKLVIEAATTTRLGKIAELIAVRGFGPEPPKIWVAEQDNAVIGLFLTEKEARAFQAARECACICRQVDPGPFEPRVYD